MSERLEEDRGASPSEPGTDRRSFLARASGIAMTAGLAAGYGTCGWMAVRFLYPAHPRPKGWMFVIEAVRLAKGQSFAYRTPAGERVTIARQADAGTVEDFAALSSTCPHLGCQVHWEAQRERFFCPCHNGTFDRDGKGTGGPPGEAGMSLPRYPLRLEDGLLYIEVPLERVVGSVARARGEAGDALA